MSEPSTPRDGMTFYAAVGGAETFHRIVARFYAGVRTDPVLRPLYPEEDLGPAEVRFRMFLEQYWGGPRTYSDERGHPRLRMRHVPFRIGIRERDAWLHHMRVALDEVALEPEAERMLWGYLTSAAHSMVNTIDEGDGLPVPTADVAPSQTGPQRPGLPLSPRD